MFEPESDAPILGLEQSIRQDAELVAAFGLQPGGQSLAEVIWSPTQDDAPPDSRSSATSHGGFDNDVDTMNSVARRILRRRDIVEFPSGPRSAAGELRSPVGGRPAMIGSPAGRGRGSRPVKQGGEATSDGSWAIFARCRQRRRLT